MRVGGYKEWHAQGIEILEDEKRLPIIILEPGKAYRREDGSVGQNFYAKEVYDISQTTARDQVQPQVRYDDRLLLKGLIASSPVPIRAVEELPQGRGAMFSAEQNAILVKKGMDAPDIFRCVSLEVANVQLAQSMDGYSRETDGYKAYAVSYMLCKRYGVDVKDRHSSWTACSRGRPQGGFPAALTDMRDTFKMNGRMARAWALPAPAAEGTGTVKEVENGKQDKVVLTLDSYEHGIMIRALNELRNDLLEEQRDPGPVEDVS